MKTELEPQDIDLITEKVVERLRPLFKANGKEPDTIFDVLGLAEYLKVEPSWIYKQVSLGKLPHFRAGKYTRFKKSAMDRWIDNQSVAATSPVRLPKR